jgi:hypothetical protein
LVRASLADAPVIKYLTQTNMKNYLIASLIIILSAVSFTMMAQPNPKQEVRQEKRKSKSEPGKERRLRVKQDRGNIRHEKEVRKQDNLENNKKAARNDNNAVKEDKKKKKDDKK